MVPNKRGCRSAAGAGGLLPGVPRGDRRSARMTCCTIPHSGIHQAAELQEFGADQCLGVVVQGEGV